MSNYPQCMKSRLGGGKMKGLDKAGRKKHFCISSKVCSGKASNEAQAAAMCR